MSKSKKPKTHFEQVPVEHVKELAVEIIPDDEEKEDDVIVDPPAKKRDVFPTKRQAR